MSAQKLFELFEQWKRDNPSYGQAQNIMWHYHRLIDPPPIAYTSGTTNGRLILVRTLETTAGYKWVWEPAP